MAFDLSTAKPTNQSSGFDLSTAKPESMEEQQPTPEVGLGGALEAAGTVASGIIAQPISGLAGILSEGLRAAGVDVPEGADVVKAVQEQLTFQPRTQEGEQALKNVGDTVQEAMEVARIPASGIGGLATLATTGDPLEAADTVKNIQELGVGEVGGNYVFEQTGSPLAATIAKTTPDAVLELIGLKGASKIAGDRSGMSKESLLSQSAPTVKQLKSEARGLYSEIDEAGVKMNSDDFLDKAIEINTKASELGLDQNLTPKSNAVLKRLESELGNDLTATDIDVLRKVAQTASNSFDNPTDSAIGSMIVDEIDNFLDIQGANTAAKAGADVGKKYRQARQLWRRARKSEMIDESVYRAEQAASGFENGLRNEMRSILKNSKKRRNFNGQEIAAMKKITEGGALENTLKRLGKLGFGVDQQTNVLAGLAGVGAGGVLGGGTGAIAVPAIGSVSAVLAKRLANKNQKMLNEIVRAGPNGREITKTYLKNVPKNERNSQDLARLLINGDKDLSGIKGMSGGDSQVIKSALLIAEKAKDYAQAGVMTIPALPELQEQE